MLSQCETFQGRKCHIVELGPLAREQVIVSNIAKVDTPKCDAPSFFLHVFRIISFLGVIHKDVIVVQKSIVGNCPFSLHDEVDLSDISFLLEHVTVFFCILELPRHEAK